MFKLYGHQVKCVSDIRKLWLKQKNVCLAWYTGAGKTDIIVELCRQLIKENPDVKIGISAYFTTEIRDQITQRLTDRGMADFAYQISRTKEVPKSKNIYVFNPQSIYNKQLAFNFDYFLIDESHYGVTEHGKNFKKIFGQDCHEKTKVLLVSATPWDTLQLKQFKNTPVLKRSLDQGFDDGLIADFRFYAEEASVEFKEKDFTRQGDLSKNLDTTKMAVLKSTCMGKMKSILSRYDDKLGQKVIVICPPGNYAEIAFTLQREFGGLCFVQAHTVKNANDAGFRGDTRSNLKRFKEDPEARFLFVVQKCCVGFDMKELSSIIDLTMTRNIKTLAQRTGRIARKNGTQEKSYFYVYDKSLMKDQLEWLIATMLDFTLGSYDGWTTKTAKYRKTAVSGLFFTHSYATTLRAVVNALRAGGAVSTKRDLVWLNDAKPPTKWDLTKAKEKMSTYENRTAMWEKNPSLYKWFRINAKAEMDRHFPLKVAFGKWNEMTVKKALKKCKTREEFKIKYSGALYWIESRKATALFDKLLPAKTKAPRWTDERAIEVLRTMPKWGDARAKALRTWMTYNGGLRYWQNVWKGLRGMNVRLHCERQPRRVPIRNSAIRLREARAKRLRREAARSAL